MVTPAASCKCALIHRWRTRDQWTGYYAWLEQAALRMSEVFRPLVKELS
jgi:hypothetical protein